MTSTTHWAASYNRPMVCTQPVHMHRWSMTQSLWTLTPPHNTHAVILYYCRDLGSGCSECLASRRGSEFMCGWCEDSCNVLQECNGYTFITEGRNCPAPFINSISPDSGNHCSYRHTAWLILLPPVGPVEGGTTITVRGTDLGVTFADIMTSTLTLGGVACTPINTDYIPGRQFVCVTKRFGTTGPNNFSMIIYGSQNVNVNAGSFSVLNPTVSSMTPTFGPVAGGTKVTVGGTGLKVGNYENTRISLEVSGGSSYVCNIM